MNEENKIIWNPIKSENDLPNEERRYLFTIENAKGERKVCLMNRRTIWLGQKIVAWSELPKPYQTGKE